MSLCHVVSEIFNVKKVVTLNRGQRSLKVIESVIIRWIEYGFLLVFLSNFVHKTHRF